MSLRARILWIYAGLAGVAVIAGVGNYVQSIRTLKDLVATKLGSTSENVASEIHVRHGQLASSLELLAASWARTSEGPEASPETGVVPTENLRSATFLRIELRAPSGETKIIAGSRELAPTGEPCAEVESVAIPVPLRGIRAGLPPNAEVVGYVRPSALLPDELLQIRLGRSGQTLIIDRSTGSTIYDARCAATGVSEQRAAAGGGSMAWREFGSSGQIEFIEGRTVKTASYASVAGLPWIALSAVAMTEFTKPYARAQLLNLGLVLAFIALAFVALLFLARHYMQSLETLSAAAQRIGNGDLSPWLPPPGTDEVGRLSHALGVMAARLRATIRQNEITRQMAIAGEVAAHLSHEIRNPLSSIRLNLQSIRRETRRGSVPTDLDAVLGLCLSEITRLDDAVTGVLELGRPKAAERVSVRVDSVVDDSLDLIRPRLRQRNIEVRRSTSWENARILGDESQLRGVFLNLLLNAADAMPEGGVLSVRTERALHEGVAEIRIHVSDTGAGVRPELREQIFQPFFTTRSSGSGIGLSVALQVTEAHGGRLWLEQRHEIERGADFVVALPLATAGSTPVQERRVTQGEEWRPERAAAAVSGE